MRRRTVIVMTGVVLAGCGFRPLYGRPDAEDGVAGLALVTVGEIETQRDDDRIGQILRNELDTLTRSPGAVRPARFRLEVRLSSTASPLAISSDDTITRYNVILEADVRLIALETQAVVYRATNRAVGSYDVQQTEYGTHIAERATREDVARDLAQRIAAMVGALLAQGR